MQQDCTVGPLRNDDNEIEYIYIMVHDVTDVAAYEEELLRINNMDGLTGIFNRLYLEQRLIEEFDRHKRYVRPFSMLMIDIDHFKDINDNYGHLCGDYILKSLSALIKNRLRTVDVFARYGGEEFCVLLPESDLTAGITLAEQLRKMIDTNLFQFNGIEIHITISLGISEISQEINTSESLVKTADDALYEAKRSGRNRVMPNK